ncbi:MAG: response regulator [Anaerolineae bacterium]|nr:response regulator [Anaerolineae bacterium]
MGKARILVVEDDFDISNMLRIYFTGQGYDVQVAPRGGDALTLTRQQLPHLIILDIMLPDMDGYAVCKELRTTTRTSHIPIIFLTQRDERSDKIAGLELGADDYITKPFDIEELKYRVKNAIDRSERESLTDPRSGLPSGRLIEDQLRSLMRQDRAWAYIDAKINYFEPFREVYGFLAGDEVLRFTALLVGEVVDEHGTPDDFIGHPGGTTSSSSASPTAPKNLRATSRRASTRKSLPTTTSSTARPARSRWTTDRAGSARCRSCLSPSGRSRRRRASSRTSARSPNSLPRAAGAAATAPRISRRAGSGEGSARAARHTRIDDPHRRVPRCALENGRRICTCLCCNRPRLAAHGLPDLAPARRAGRNGDAPHQQGLHPRQPGRR